MQHKHALPQPTSRGLAYVRGDSTYELHKRVGRFSIEREAAKSFHHLYARIALMQEAMIAGLKRKGFEYTGASFELRGPFEHLDIAEDDSPDPGPAARPDPRDLQANAVWERAERARIAKRLGLIVALVDYELVVPFRVRIRGQLHRTA